MNKIRFFVVSNTLFWLFIICKSCGITVHVEIRIFGYMNKSCHSITDPTNKQATTPIWNRRAPVPVFNSTLPSFNPGSRFQDQFMRNSSRIQQNSSKPTSKIGWFTSIALDFEISQRIERNLHLIGTYLSRLCAYPDL